MSETKEPPPSDPSPRAKHLELVVTQTAPRKGKAFLMVSAGEAAGTVFPLTQSSLLIGRSADAEVRINENAVSNEHARVELSGSRFTIRDLESTNGTYLNGRRVIGSAPLTGGDAIRTGSTTFTFVTREGAMPAATVRLADFSPDPSIATRVNAAPARRERMAPAPISEGEIAADSISLTDVVRTIKASWVYVRRYIWLATACMVFGIGVGLVQARLNPPPGSAWFEMTLQTEGRGDEADGVQFFVAAESTFKSLPLIKKTLQQLGAVSVSDAAASEIQSALSFERMGFNSSVWRGDYRDSSAERAVNFLENHVDVYVSSEIDKIVKVLEADAQFDRQQEAAADERVSDARNRLIEFMDEHPDAVPKDAKVPTNPQPVRLPAGASTDRIRQSIVTTETALAAALSSIQAKKARPYLDQAAEAEAKIAEAKARGLGDQHPEVKNLVSLATAMRGKANQVSRAQPNETEQGMDGEVVKLKQELVDLRKRLEAEAPGVSGGAAAPTAGSSRSAAAAKPILDTRNSTPQSLAQLKLQYAELSREYERAKTDHEALLKKRETTDRQLERERTLARARYDIITPPTGEKPRATPTFVKRGGLGGLLGLGLALVAAACLELRRTLIARGHL